MLTWVEVDLGAIKKNISAIKKYLGPKVLLALVIKSNAYGHGMVEVAKIASQVGVEFLCVDNVSEAKQIQNHKSKIPKILILGGVESEDLEWVIKNNVRLALFDSIHPRTFCRSSQSSGICLIHLALSLIIK